MPADLAALAPRLLAWLQARQPAALDLLRHWVELESPSDDKPALDACGRQIADAFASIAQVTVEPQSHAGDHYRIHFASEDEPGPGVLLLGHLDTVYPLGTLRTMPFHVEGERAFGPGVLDMKGGLAIAFQAWAALRALGLRPRRAATLLLVSDEEIGSATARPLIERYAREAAAVLVLEPGSGASGHLKTARKGIAHFVFAAEGVPAHAGVDFERGASAVLELARQAVHWAERSDSARGITVNPGVLRGGTRSNVVAAQASLELDVRAWSGADLAALATEIQRAAPADPRIRLTVGGGVNRPPMERSPATAALFARARDCAALLGQSVAESATGGGSDGNFTAALGVPTLDGLGAIGAGAHTPGESIRAASLAPRAALLALLLLAL